MNLEWCCFRDVQKVQSKVLYGFKEKNEDKTDKFIDLVACDEHAKKRGFI